MAITDQVGPPALDAREDFVAHAPSPLERAILGVFVIVPLTAVLVGIPLAFAYGWVRWLDIAMLAVLYVVGVHGITIGYHRMFTHGAFQAGPKCAPPSPSRGASRSRAA